MPAKLDTPTVACGQHLHSCDNHVELFVAVSAHAPPLIGCVQCLNRLQRQLGRRRRCPNLTLRSAATVIERSKHALAGSSEPCEPCIDFRTNVTLVPQEGFEPPTHALRMRCSTPELLRLYPLFTRPYYKSLALSSSLAPSRVRRCCKPHNKTAISDDREEGKRAAQASPRKQATSEGVKARP
jgi:hypothetical protein